MGEPAERVPFVGLTGGLGAGKSTALEAVAELGAATLSTDAVVHELLGTERGARSAVVERLGADVVRDGAVDRAAVAGRVFDARRREREWLEGLLWPLVGERMVEWRAEVDAQRPVPPAAVVEVPLLFESGMEAVFDQHHRRGGRRGPARASARAGAGTWRSTSVQGAS